MYCKILYTHIELDSDCIFKGFLHLLREYIWTPLVQSSLLNKIPIDLIGPVALVRMAELGDLIMSLLFLEQYVKSRIKDPFKKLKLGDRSLFGTYIVINAYL